MAHPSSKDKPLAKDTSKFLISNDYEYESAIKRELQAVGKEGDVLICLSTSGKSINIKSSKCIDTTVLYSREICTG